MSSFLRHIETAIKRLTKKPAFAAFARPNSGLLVWGEGAKKIVWASPAAEPLRRVLTSGHGGTINLPKAEWDHLKRLADGEAPYEGVRLERLRLNPVRHAAPLTCACCRMVIEGFEPVLVIGILGQIPLIKTHEEVKPNTSIDPAMEVSERIEWLRRTRSARFVWQADADLRIVSVSAMFAEIVGLQSSRIVGLTWQEILKNREQEHPGAIIEYLARRETWSGEYVFWPIDESAYEVGIELAGQPILNEQRLFSGYRGFGICRGNKLREVVRATASPSIDIERQSKKTLVQSSSPEGRFVPLAATERQLSEADKLSLKEIALALESSIGRRPNTTHHNSLIGQSPNHQPTEPPPESNIETPSPKTRDALFRKEQLLNRLPVGILIHRGEDVLFANSTLLEMVGYATVDRLAALGVVGLFRDSPVLATTEGRKNNVEHPFLLANANGDKIAVEVRLSSVEWEDVPASLMLIRQSAETDIVEQLRKSERDNRERGEKIRELESILATATDGIVTIDEVGRILSLNSSGEALFGYESREVVGELITFLLASESHMVALDYLDGLRLRGVASLLEGGREVIGRVNQGGTIPLFMSVGRISDGTHRKLCVVLRDITAFKKAESELMSAKRAAEEASAQKSDLLAKISHEIRTPLNAIIGFAEMMLEERLGSVGNERYKSYLRDIHISGAHVMSLVNDLLDLAKIEAGHMELNFTSVHLNDLVASCVGLMQQQATRDRIVMRTSFATRLPAVVADERSVRQIILNLLSNALKFTDSGGQVIVSTAMTDDGSVVVRVRDTGIGMDESEITAALEPFRQLSTSRQRGGTGLGLPLTKALIEANRGSLEISSARNEGTLAEVFFPQTRVLAE